MATEAQRVVFFVLLAIIVVPHLLSVIVQLDIWPFSHYPMYSSKKQIDDCGWFHVVLEHADGTRKRWTPSHIRFSREVNRAFTKLMREQPAADSPSRLELLLDIVERRVRDDHRSVGDLDAIREMQIIYITCPKFRSGDFTQLEQIRHRRSLARAA